MGHPETTDAGNPTTLAPEEAERLYRQRMDAFMQAKPDPGVQSRGAGTCAPTAMELAHAELDAARASCSFTDMLMTDIPPLGPIQMAGDSTLGTSTTEDDITFARRVLRDIAGGGHNKSETRLEAVHTLLQLQYQ